MVKKLSTTRIILYITIPIVIIGIIVLIWGIVTKFHFVKKKSSNITTHTPLIKIPDNIPTTFPVYKPPNCCSQNPDTIPKWLNGYNWITASTCDDFVAPCSSQKTSLDCIGSADPTEFNSGVGRVGKGVCKWNDDDNKCENIPNIKYVQDCNEKKCKASKCSWDNNTCICPMQEIYTKTMNCCNNLGPGYKPDSATSLEGKCPGTFIACTPSGEKQCSDTIHKPFCKWNSDTSVCENIPNIPFMTECTTQQQCDSLNEPATSHKYGRTCIWDKNKCTCKYSGIPSTLSYFSMNTE